MGISRRFCALLIAGLLAAASCTKYIDVPRDQYDDTRPAGSYRIRMKANTEYVAYLFSVTDSTLVISRLSPLDEGDRERELPITLRLDDVESVALVEPSKTAPIVMISVFAALIGLLIWGSIAFGDYPSD